MLFIEYVDEEAGCRERTRENRGVNSMIVDVHTHSPTHVGEVPANEKHYYGGWHTGDPVSTANSHADYQKGMVGADISIVFNIHVPDTQRLVGTPGDPLRINEDTADFVKSDSTRIGFMSVDPNRYDWIEEMDKSIELGLVGIKLGANYQRFDPLGREALRLYGRAEKLGLPILFHTGASPVREAPLLYSHPVVTDEVAIRFPDLKIVMAHVGHPWVRETVVVIRKHPNVYADVSAIYTRPWMTYEGLIMATEWGVTHKLLFGSDFPVTTPNYAIERLRAVNDILEGTKLPRISMEHIEGIIHADALTALNLKDPRKK
jgi:predicted TIM-barrel fold metal-dependent hydrolase